MIFVTGGTGLLGNCVVRELLARGISPRVLCRPGSPRTPFDGLDVEIIEGDLDSVDVLRSAIQGCSAVIHCAAYIHIGWSKLEESRRANVRGTKNLADACAEHGCRLIYVSTVDTLPAAVDKQHPISETTTEGIAKTQCSYVVSKVEAEQLVRERSKAGLDVVIVHPGFMLGPYDWKPSSGRMMLEVNKAPIVAAPPGGCSVCDSRDVAQAVVNSVEMGRAGENYILAGENLTYQEFWRNILEVSGRKRRVWQMGKGVRLVGKVVDNTNRWLGRTEGDVNGASIGMGLLNHFYNSDKAELALAYTRRPYGETLTDAWQWLTAHR